ncbi:protein-transporting protein BCP1 PWA37_001522 [Arxiozyma heterogenica]|uniref:protein-transporting protein BCP1 n=1 Tax=Arxiozyma heterogenica TaxID=278026 RepID=UPI002EE43FD1
MVTTLKLSELTSRKRRNEENENTSEESEIDISSTDSENEGKVGGEEDDDTDEIINIDFDFYNGNPDIDFHALKNLSRQLFGPQESNRIQLSALADLMLASPMTTIKTDGPESDPYCFLSFIDYKDNKTCDYVKYLIKVDPKLSTFLQTIDNTGNKSCALVVSERLINMPPEVVPPLYKITLEDVSKSLNESDKEHYDFYLIATRKYEVNFDIDDDSSRNNNSERSNKRVKQEEIDYFHEEDRFFEKYAKIHFETEARKGIISSYMVLTHEGLISGIEDLENEIAQW